MRDDITKTYLPINKIYHPHKKIHHNCDRILFLFHFKAFALDLIW